MNIPDEALKAAAERTLALTDNEIMEGRGHILILEAAAPFIPTEGPPVNRPIRTKSEVEALPIGTVFQDRATNTWEVVNDGAGRNYQTTGSDARFGIYAIPIPCEVLRLGDGA